MSVRGQLQQTESEPGKPMFSNLKQRIFEIIEEDIVESLAHNIFEIFITVLIISNVIAAMFESINNFRSIFREFEFFSVIIFTAEYALRIWTANLKYPVGSTVRARVRFILSPMGIIDLLSILPFYFSLIFAGGIDTVFIRVLRLSRLLRLVKLKRYYDSFSLIERVIKKKKYELLITAFIVFLLLFVSSTLMFEIEHDAQPDKFPNILSACWWAIATLTTIGYGDVYPITALGKFLSAVISLIGIGLVAMPTGIISSGFMEEFKHEDHKAAEESDYTYCPHCGKKLKG